MLFNAPVFLTCFLPATLAIYWTLRHFRRPGWAIVALAVASYFFYAYGETNYPWLILVSIAFNFLIGRTLTAATGRARPLLFTCGIAGNLLALGYFKYANFISANLIAVIGVGEMRESVILPIGISFFTFTQIAFLVDTYRRTAAEADPIRYFLFVTFFPHLIAGPILHHKEMMPQFARLRESSWISGIATGAPLFAIGLFKKCVVADTLSPAIAILFNRAQSGGTLTLLDGWMAALCYTVQIYADFSGYSDMAIGLGRMFAIDLPINFNSPYKAMSIIDFWRRWHITLSRFLRDYLYFGLGGNRHGRIRRYFNLFLTMLLGGLWHGAGWTFIVWGALHGAYLMVNHLWRTLFPNVAIPRLASRTITLLAVVIAWVPFRAASLSTAVSIWAGMFGLNGVALPNIPQLLPLARLTHLPLNDTPYGRVDMILIVLVSLACLILPNSQEWMARFRLGLDTPGYHAVADGAAGRFWAFRLNWASAIAAGLVLGIALRYVGGYSEFIYFQF